MAESKNEKEDNIKNVYNSINDLLTDIKKLSKKYDALDGKKFEEIYINSLNKDKSNDYYIIPTPRDLIDFSYDLLIKIAGKNKFSNILDPYMGTGGFLVKAKEKLGINEYYGFEKKSSLEEVNKKYFDRIGFDKIGNIKYEEFNSNVNFKLIATNPNSDINFEEIKKIIVNNLENNGFLLILLQDEKLKEFKHEDLNQKIDPKIVVKLPSGLFPKASGISTNLVLIQKQKYSGNTVFVNFREQKKDFLQKTGKKEELLKAIENNYKNGKFDDKIINDYIILKDWKKENNLSYKFETTSNIDTKYYYQILEKSLFEGLGQLRAVNYLLEQNNISSISNNISKLGDKKIIEIIEEIQNSPQKIQSEKLYEILIALTVSNFLILSGPSGVGKTSLVKKLSYAIGGKYLKFPIKSNFTDESGLLGYYNPLLSKYEGTEVLKHIFESALNRDIPYFLLLDEMNLSRIENYFSDFLARIDDIKSSGSDIKLFDVLIDNKAKFSNIKYFIDKYNLTSEQVKVKNGEFGDIANGEFEKNLEIEVNIKLYSNLHIIGTINEDETTNSLSNKVLDRAFYISLGMDDLFEDKEDKFLQNIEDKNYQDITSKNILNLAESQKELEKYKEFINKINEKIQEINKNDAIGYRVIEDIATYMQNYKENINKFHEKEFLDIVFCQKVWPKIKNYSIIGEKETKFEDLMKYVGEYLSKDSESYKFLEYLYKNLF